METLYLKFNSKEECYNKLKDFRKKDELNNYEYWSLEGADFDEVGTIYKPTGETITDDNGIEIPVMEAVDGWHLNVLCRTKDIADKITNKIDSDNIINPKTPSRVFV